MASSSAILIKFACVVLACMVVAAPRAEAAITCATVDSSLSPCLPYLRSTGGMVPPACCIAITSLNNAAKTTPDRQATCNCIKSAAAGIPGINLALAASLPSKCGLNLPYPISPSTDCSKVQ